MWPRVVEFMFALWLLLSPFIFDHASPEGREWWISDVISSVCLGTLALLSFTKRFGGAHWFILIVAAWLIVYGYVAGGHPSPPGAKNEMVIGLILTLTAIIPNHATEPPRAWRPANRPPNREATPKPERPRG